MSAIIYAFLILSFLGLALGIGLAFADKKFAVNKDEKLIALEEMMPGANCGGCGFAGCASYAQAVFEGKAQPGLCVPGGAALSEKMGKVLGVEVKAPEKKVAFVFCKGNCNTTDKSYKYYGLNDCNALALLFKGDNSCKFGCLHMGSCIKVCESQAISMDKDGNISVNPDKCIGCGKCASVCPNQVIRLIPADSHYAVACSSRDKGADVNRHCKVGCIGCKICEVKFPQSGFKVENNLSVYDNISNTEDTQKAMAACPKKVIVKR